MTQWKIQTVSAVIGDYLVYIASKGAENYEVTTYKWDGNEYRWHDEFTEDTLEKAQKHAERLWEALSR